MFKSIVLSLSLVVVNQIFAANQFILIGGGEITAAPNTIFDEGLKNLIPFSKNSNWDTTLYFNGTHPNTIEIKKYLASENNIHNFSPEDYKKFLNDLNERLDRNEISNNDKVMLIIDSHGAEKEGKSQISHSITTNVYGNRADLDQLIPILKKLKNKNIKAAIIDQSCHSGNIHELKSFYPSACFISSTSETNLGYTTFANKFYKSLTEGSNLEFAFLKARSLTFMSDIPRISGEIGDLLNTRLDPLKKILLDGSVDPLNPRSTKIENYIQIQIDEHIAANRQDDLKIPLPKGTEEMLNYINNTLNHSGRSTDSSKTSVDFAKFNRHVNGHNKLINKLSDLMLKNSRILNNNQETITSSPTLFKYEVTWEDIFNFNESQLEQAILKAEAEKNSNKNSSDLEFQVNYITQALAQKNIILKSEKYKNLEIKSSKNPGKKPFLKENKVTLEVLGPVNTQKYSWKYILEYNTTYFSQELALAEKNRNTTTDQLKTLKENVFFANQIKTMQENILKSKAYMEITKNKNAIANILTEINSSVLEIAREEKKIYELLYRDSTTTNSNPCRNFIL